MVCWYGATPLYHIINKLADILLSQAAMLVVRAGLVLYNYSA